MTRLRHIAPEQMEQLTERILRDFGFDPDAKRIGAVPIEELVEFHFDLAICWETIDHLDADGVVMAAILPEQRRIVLNETQRTLFDSKLGTYHFTLAHELGHWVLHTAQTDYWLRTGGQSDRCRVSREVEQPYCGMPGTSSELQSCSMPSTSSEQSNYSMPSTSSEQLYSGTSRNAEEQPYYCRGASGRPLEELQADRFAGCLLMPRPMMVRTISQLRKLGAVQLMQLYGLADCFRVSISALTVRLKQLRLIDIDGNGQVHVAGQSNQGAVVQLTLDI